VTKPILLRKTEKAKFEVEKIVQQRYDEEIK